MPTKPLAPRGYQWMPPPKATLVKIIFQANRGGEPGGHDRPTRKMNDQRKARIHLAPDPMRRSKDATPE